MNISLRRQFGVTLGGMMVFMLLLILVAYTLSRIGPAYLDDWMVAGMLKDLAAQPGIQNDSDESIRTQFAKRLNLNNITLITSDDLLIERDSGLHLSAPFTSKQHFLGAVSLCLDFQPQADAPASGNRP